jgi:hypothetical protein
MNRIFTLHSLAIGCLFACLPANITAAPLDAPPASTFEVNFDGLIIHDLDPEHPQRSIIVQGDGSMPHVPLLITGTDIDEATLAAATGQPVFCGVAAGEKDATCRVLIDKIDLRVVGSDGSSPLQALAEDAKKTFSNLTPHLSKVTSGTLLDSVTAATPPNGVAGFFELTGGTLSACALISAGYFVPDLDKEKNRFFADIVTLSGNVDPSVTAVLQIRSKATQDQWMSVTHDTATPLKITIDNHAPRKKGTLTASTHHFDLLKKLLSVTPSGFPVVCAAPPQQSDTLCYNNKPTGFLDQGDFNTCPPKAVPNMPGAAPKVARTTKAKSVKKPKSKTNQVTPGGPSLELLPGCTNSTWP